MFPRAAIDEDQVYEVEVLGEPGADGYNDIIDWDLPLRKAVPEAVSASEPESEEQDGEVVEANGNDGGEDATDVASTQPASQQSAAPIGANEAPDGSVLELGIQLMDASVSHAVCLTSSFAWPDHL